LGDIILLIFSLAVILLGAELFTNGVEWLGKKLQLGEGAVGSILAAVGTALPETMVPVIAIFTAGESGGQEVGLGAILGAPFMLGTLAFFVAGCAALFYRRSNSPLKLNVQVLQRDLKFFMIVYTLAVAASFLPGSTLKTAAVVFLLGAYAVYVCQTIGASRGRSCQDELPPCYFSRKNPEPLLPVIAGQVIFALLVIAAGARFFVGAVQNVALNAGIPVFILALIITPIATELPEKFNSILWLHRGKDTLALGNITGAMVFQSSVIPALGIVLTPWILEPLALLSAILVLISALIQYFILRRAKTLFPASLLGAGVFYVIFVVCLFKGLY